MATDPPARITVRRHGPGIRVLINSAPTIDLTQLEAMRLKASIEHLLEPADYIEAFADHLEHLEEL